VDLAVRLLTRRAAVGNAQARFAPEGGGISCRTKLHLESHHISLRSWLQDIVKIKLVDFAWNRSLSIYPARARLFPGKPG